MRRYPAYHGRKWQRGISLPEVCVSLALLALSITALSMACVSALEALERTRIDWNEVTLETWVVREIAQVEERDALFRGGEMHLPDGDTVRWHAQAEPGPVVDLFHLRYTLEGMRDADGKTLTLNGETWLYQPNWSDPTERDDRLLRLGEKRTGVFDDE